MQHFLIEKRNYFQQRKTKEFLIYSLKGFLKLKIKLTNTFVYNLHKSTISSGQGEKIGCVTAICFLEKC